MAQRYFGRRLTTAWRLFWRCVAGLLVFAQVAAAADLCVSVGGEAAPVEQGASTGDFAAGIADADCVSDLAAPDQAPAADTGNLAAVSGPAPALHSPWPSMPSARHTRYVAPVRHRSPTLLFRNLRL